MKLSITVYCKKEVYKKYIVNILKSYKRLIIELYRKATISSISENMMA